MTRVVVVGASGRLGRALVPSLARRGHDVIGLGRNEMDLESGAGLERLSDAGPDIVVNAAAWTDVDGCAREPERATRVNGDGAGRVAAASGQALVVQISTNEVFDGRSRIPYTEDDEPNPINPYGASKLAGERAVGAAARRSIIVRTAWLFEAGSGFPTRISRAADEAVRLQAPLRVVRDEWGNPTPTVELARALGDLLALADRGTVPAVLHLAGEPPTTRLAWATKVLASRDIRIQPITRAEFDRPSGVPERAILSMERGRTLGIDPIRWERIT